MARSLNKLMIIGNLGADPETRVTQGGTKVCNLRVATNERWKTKDGQEQDHTEWHRVVCYGSLADIADKYLRKGSTAYFEGSLRTDKWTDRDGNDRYTTELRAHQLLLLDSSGARGDNNGYESQADPNPGPELDDADIPF